MRQAVVAVYFPSKWRVQHVTTNGRECNRGPVTRQRFGAEHCSCRLGGVDLKGRITCAVRVAFSRRFATVSALSLAARTTMPDPVMAASTPATGRIAARAIEGFVSLAIIERKNSDRILRLTARAKGCFMTDFKFNGVVA